MITKTGAAVLAGSLILFAASWWTLVMKTRPAAAAPGHDEPTRNDTVPSVRGGHFEPMPTVERSAASSESRLVRLVCEIGSAPVAGVAAYCVDAGAREASDSCRIGALSGKDGILEVDAGVAAMLDKSLVLICAQCQPVGMQLPLKPGDYHVNMVPGGSVTLHVEDGVGESQAGVVVALSQMHLGRATKPEGVSVPGPDQNTAIYRGVSDSQGNLTISGLPTAVYLTGIAVPPSRVITLCDLRPSVNIDGSPLTFNMKLGCIALGVARIRGDMVLGCYPQYDRTQVLNSSHNSDVVRATKEELQRAYPDAYVDAIAVNSVDSAVSVQTRVLLQKCGERSIEVRYRVGDPAVTNSDFSADGQVKTPFDCLVRVIDPQGHEVADVSMFLHTTTVPREPIGIPIRSGRVVALPAGAYKLRSSEAWLDQALKARRDVVVGGNVTIDIACQQVMRLCSISVASAAHAALESVLIKAEAVGFRVVVESANPISVPLWLPVGDLTLTLSSPGHVESVRQIAVLSGEATQSIDLKME